MSQACYEALDVAGHCGQLEEARRVVLHGVLNCTSKLVEDAMHGNWLRVLEGMDERRRLMEMLNTDDGEHDGRIAAVHAAVAESEQAFARVVAHAVISSSWHGAEHAMFH